MGKTIPSFFNNKRSVINTLIVIASVVYLKALSFDFSPLDEDWLIIRDESFLKDWKYLIGALNDSIQGLYYRPMQIVTYIIDYHIGQLSPFIYHFTNVFLHVFSVAMLYKLLVELHTEKVMTFFLAAIFAIHPITLHAVAWIPGRHDLLLCLFTISSCYYLIRYLTQNKITGAILHFLFFALALFTKENAIFLLPVYVFIFFIFPQPDKKRLIVFGVIWAALLAFWYFMLTSIIKTALTAGHDFFSTLKSFIYAMLMFFGKSVIPVHQSVAPVVDNVSVVAGIIAIALIAFVWFKIGVANKKIALLGLTVYLVLLAVPVWFGATLPTGEHLEHRVYTSMIGLMILFGQFKFNTASKLTRNILTVLVLVLALKTFMRMNIYKNGLTYITEAAQDCPTNYFYHARKGNFLSDEKKYLEALASYNTAISLYNKKPQVFNDRANIYFALGKKDEAIADYTKAYELGKNPQVLVFRCLAYKKFGDFQNAFNDLTTLTQCCADLIPKGTEQEILTGLVGSRLTELNKLIATDPNNAILYVNRAKFYMDSRMGPEALADLKKACELDPKNEAYKGYYKELSSSFPH